MLGEFLSLIGNPTLEKERHIPLQLLSIYIQTPTDLHYHSTLLGLNSNFPWSFFLLQIKMEKKRLILEDFFSLQRFGYSIDLLILSPMV